MKDESNSPLPDENTCWQAVLERSSEWNGRLFYGVRSTGIYCRPSCPSRRPTRAQVQFFGSAQEAEAAGFRACKRCQPQQSLAPQTELVERACRMMDAAARPLSLAELGQALAVNPSHLLRVFKRTTGITPRQYGAAQRTATFKAQVRQGQNVTTALYQSGYGSASRLYEESNQALGMTPGAYLRGGSTMKIDYAIVDCPLGRMLVAATARGICGLAFADGDVTLESFIANEFPAAERRRDDHGLGSLVRALLANLEGSLPQLDLPLDVQATAFQRRVWEELRRIPYGETRTYSQIAAAIGEPNAVRAAAHACATNPASLIIPCHRVLRRDGSLGGYRWGLERKQRLLEREQQLKKATE